MFYIHHTSCISPQQTFSEINLETLYLPKDGKLMATEPKYTAIPSGMLRRMGKALRLGVGAAMPLMNHKLDGFILGTDNGGIEDCYKFLNQIVEYQEGLLAPGNFVQGTPNAVGGHLGIFSKNNGYNLTHVHHGLAFENAVIDAMMLLEENPNNDYLLGGFDELSSYNYNIDYLTGFYKDNSGTNFYETNAAGSIAGEGSAMFVVNKNERNAIACFKAIHIFQSKDESVVQKQLQLFLEQNVHPVEKIDLFLSGENGDNRYLKFYEVCENITGNDMPVLRFKHMTGEYGTASATALWLACNIFQNKKVPMHMIKNSEPRQFNNMLIYNCYKGTQHSFMLVGNSIL